MSSPESSGPVLVPSADEGSGGGGGGKRGTVAPRNPAACVACRKAKVRCDISTQGPGIQSCSRCIKTNRECLLPDPTTRRRKLTPVAPVRGIGGQPLASGSTDPSPMQEAFAIDPMTGGLDATYAQSIARNVYATSESISPVLPSSIQRVRADVGEGYDPVDAGIIDETDLSGLFDFYFANLQPMLPILDPQVHTLDYVRTTSSTLVTAIALAAASSSPQHRDVSERLEGHVLRIRDQIVASSLASVELIIAFVVLAAYPLTMDASRNTLWLGVAHGMARELRLDRDFIQRRSHPDKRQDFANTSTTPEVRRYMRAQERAFIGLLVWDQISALLHDQSCHFWDDKLLTTLDIWVAEPLSHQSDAVLSDMLMLCLKCSQIRFQVEGLVAQDPSTSTPPLILSLVRQHIDLWVPRARSSARPEQPLPHRQETMLALLQGQAQLWSLSLGLSYASTLNHDLSMAVWRAAVGCSEAVTQRADSLKHLPASVTQLIAYGAILVLNLAPTDDDHFPRANVFELVLRVARFLEGGSASIDGGHTSISTYLASRLNQLVQDRQQNDYPAHVRDLWPPHSAVTSMHVDGRQLAPLLNGPGSTGSRAPRSMGGTGSERGDTGSERPETGGSVGSARPSTGRSVLGAEGNDGQASVAVDAGI